MGLRISSPARFGHPATGQGLDAPLHASGGGSTELGHWGSWQEKPLDSNLAEVAASATGILLTLGFVWSQSSYLAASQKRARPRFQLRLTQLTSPLTVGSQAMPSRQAPTPTLFGRSPPCRGFRAFCLPRRCHREGLMHGRCIGRRKIAALRCSSS